MKKQNWILNHTEENKVLFLFVTDKYSSLIIVNKQIKFVSFPKEWENMRRCIFLGQHLT